MNNSKLVETISLFSKEEHIKFKDSCFYNDSRVLSEVRNLYLYLYENEHNPDKKDIHAVLFPDKIYSENRLNKTMTVLQKILEEFIVYEYANLNDKIRRNLNLVKFYRLKNAPERFELVIKKIKQDLEKQTFKDKKYYYTKLLYEIEILEQKYLSNSKRDDAYLLKIIESIDSLYVVTRLEFQIYFETQAMVSNVDIAASRNIVERIKPIIESKDNGFNQITLIQIYKQILYILQNIDTLGLEDIKHLEVFLKKHLVIIPKDLLVNFLILCINFYTRKYNQGNNNALKYLFDLNKFYIESIEDTISFSMFQNMINVALKLKEVNWAKYLLDNVGHVIIGHEQVKEIYNFNLYNYYFHIKSFDKIDINVCFNTNYNDIYYSLAAKRLELKYYYEIKEDYLFEVRLEAFKIWLHRKKETLSQLYFDVNNDFIDILRQIIASKALKNKERINKLMEKVTKNPAVAEREWLLEKLYLLQK